MIGLASTLVALRVPKHAVDSAARIINSYAGVTHNYEREGRVQYLVYPYRAASEEGLASTLEEIKWKIHPLDSLVVPVRRVLKLRTNFKL